MLLLMCVFFDDLCQYCNRSNDYQLSYVIINDDIKSANINLKSDYILYIIIQYYTTYYKYMYIKYLLIVTNFFLFEIF